jgi:hypothetical protein
MPTTQLPDNEGNDGAVNFNVKKSSHSIPLLQTSNTSGVEITTRQLAKCEWNLKLASIFLTYSPAWRVIFPPLSESFLPVSAHCTNAQQRHDFGEFFSDLASKNFELLASLASVLKILIPPLNTCTIRRKPSSHSIPLLHKKSNTTRRF